MCELCVWGCVVWRVVGVVCRVCGVYMRVVCGMCGCGFFGCVCGVLGM